jgi:hypothetical protein
MSETCWPSRRELLDLGYTLGYLQATVDIAKQPAPKSGASKIKTILSRVKDWAEGYELMRKAWEMQRRLALPVLIVSWWDSIIWLVRLIFG